MGLDGLQDLVSWDGGLCEKQHWQVEHCVSCWVLHIIIVKKPFTLTGCKALIRIWNTVDVNLFAVDAMTNQALANFTKVAVSDNLDFNDTKLSNYRCWTTDMVKLGPSGDHAGYGKAMAEYLEEGYLKVIEAVEKCGDLNAESKDMVKSELTKIHSKLIKIREQ